MEIRHISTSISHIFHARGQASEGLLVLSGLDVIDGTPCLDAGLKKWMG